MEIRFPGFLDHQAFVEIARNTEKSKKVMKIY